MAELAQQAKYSGPWDDTPIDTAQTHVGLLLLAGEDAMQTLADAIVSDHTPLYAYVPLARSGLEWLALAHWLGDPAIDARERVRRSLNERIYSAWEQQRLPPGMNPEPERQARLLEAQRLGFTVTPAKRKQLRVLAPRRPSITTLIQRVLGGDDLGRLLYGYFSAISHGTLWGLVERVDAGEVEWSSSVMEAPLVVRSDNIAMVAASLLIAHRRTYGGYVNQMGWQADGWHAAAADAATLAQSLFTDKTATETRGVRAWTQVGPGELWLP